MKRLLCSALVALAMAPAVAEGHPAWGIVVDDQGRILFSDVGMNAIWMIEVDGKLKRLASSVHSHELWAEPAGDLLYGVHAYWIESQQRPGSFTWRMRPGQSKERIPAFPRHIGSLSGPNGSRYEADGRRILHHGADRQIQVLGGERFAALPRRDDTLRSIAIDTQGSLYAADFEYHCVWKIPAGRPAERMFETGNWWSPTGVAVKGDKLYVLEDRPFGWKAVLAFWEAPRVVQVHSDGRRQVLMTIDFYRHYVVFGGLGLVALLVVLIWTLRHTRPVKGA